MTIAFHTHWQELLHNYLLRRQNEAFAWGSMDCCLFACDAVLELTGVDLARDFRGKYDSLLSAVRAMKSFTTEDTEPLHGADAPLAQLAEAVPLRSPDHPITGSPDQDDFDLVEAVAVKIAEQFQIEDVPVLMAQRGDVVLLDSPLGKGLGILGLRGTHVHCTGHDGVVDVPLQECLRAWRIPKFAPVPPEATIQKAASF